MIDNGMISGRRVALRPLRTSDYEPIRLIEQHAGATFTWRFRGRTMSPEAHSQTLWAGVHVQYVVALTGTWDSIGLVSCYDADFENGHAFLATLRFPVANSELPFGEGTALFIDHLFHSWAFRCLYVDTTQAALDSYQTVGRKYLREEGRLRDYYRMPGGERSDRVLLTLDNDTWTERSPRLLRRARGTTAGR
jgi:hypothetical protein